MNIKKDIMASSRNYTKCNSRTIKYIVIHGTGCVAPCKNYCLNLKNNKCSGSAHYFVGDGEIRQAIDDNNIAWHVGNPNNCYKVKNSDCKNKNSIKSYVSVFSSAVLSSALYTYLSIYN